MAMIRILLAPFISIALDLRVVAKKSTEAVVTAAPLHRRCLELTTVPGLLEAVAADAGWDETAARASSRTRGASGIWEGPADPTRL